METVKQPKIALVTGGGSGIGLAITEKFVCHGIRTIIIGRNQEKLNEAQKKLGENCIPVCFDLTDLAGIPAMVQKLVKQYGYIDTLVNNAGINQKKDFIDVTDADFQNILLTNVTA